MTVTISKSEFKARSSEIIRQVEETGESVTITFRNRPVAELRPVRPSADPLALLRGTVLEFTNPTEPVAGVDEWSAAQ